MTTPRLAFDRSSVRTVDRFGRLHVQTSNISKATVNPYRGAEIPNWQALGLDPQRVYNMLRHPDELAKGAATFNNVPLLDEHIPVDATANDSHHPYAVVGSTGTDAVMTGEHLSNSLVIWAKPSIDRVNNHTQRELSSSYAYDADMTPGNYRGLHYDGIMRNIVANHVALVKLGRAGRDVLVGDAELEVMPVALKTRTALMVHGALNALVRPLLAADKALDLSAPLDDITAGNLTDRAPALATAIVTSITPHLAADTTLTEADVLAALVTVAAVPLAADEADDLTVIAPPARVVDKLIVSAVQQPAPIVQGITQAAMDSALAAHGTAVVERMNAVRAAEREVESYVGTVKVAMDSAPDVYKLALDHLKVDVAGVDPSAYGAILRAQPVPGSVVSMPSRNLALDAAAHKSFAERYPNRTNLIRGA